MIVRVRCTFEVDVVMDDSYRSDPDLLQFVIEENCCPGGGSVGPAVEAAIAYGEANGECWACPGTNKIVAIDGVPVTET